MDVGATLRKAREAADLSQAGLARRAGTSQSFVSDVERGRVHPSVRRLEGLLRAANAHVEIVVQPEPALDPDDLHLIRRNLGLTPAQRLAQLRNRMRLRGLATR